MADTSGDRPGRDGIKTRPLSLAFALGAVTAALVGWPMGLHAAFDVLVREFGYDGGVAFPFYAVIHYLLFVVFSLVVCAIARARLTRSALTVSVGISMVAGPASLLLGLSSETLTNVTMAAMGVLLITLIKGTATVFRMAILCLSGVLVSVQLIHHASMSFGPYVDDNSRIQSLLTRTTDALATGLPIQGDGCEYSHERIDECRVFPDRFADNYSTYPVLTSEMKRMREGWSQTGHVQYGHYRQSKDLSRQWVLRFDGADWAVARKDNQFLIHSYVPVLAWLFGWATFWWTLTFVLLTVWHQRSDRATLRQQTPRVLQGLGLVMLLHVAHYLMLSLNAGHLIPESLVLSAQRRNDLVHEFSDWLMIMAAVQFLGIVLLSALVWLLHKWIKKQRLNRR